MRYRHPDAMTLGSLACPLSRPSCTPSPRGEGSGIDTCTLISAASSSTSMQAVNALAEHATRPMLSHAVDVRSPYCWLFD